MTFPLAARYADEVNIDAAVDEMADAIEAGRAAAVTRSAATRRPSCYATGTNPAWPYPGLKIIGTQRMMTQEDLPAIMDYDFRTILPRADELRRWVELGLDQVDLRGARSRRSDEGLYELIEDCRAAEVEFLPAIAST